MLLCACVLEWVVDYVEEADGRDDITSNSPGGVRADLIAISSSPEVDVATVLENFQAALADSDDDTPDTVYEFWVSRLAGSLHSHARAPLCVAVLADSCAPVHSADPIRHEEARVGQAGPCPSSH